MQDAHDLATTLFPTRRVGTAPRRWLGALGLLLTKVVTCVWWIASNSCPITFRGCCDCMRIYLYPCGSAFYSGSCYIFANLNRRRRYLYRFFYAPVLRSYLLDCVTHRYPRDAIDKARRVEFDLEVGVTNSLHTHPFAQAARVAALNTIENYAKALGVGVYSVSTSKREDARGWSGERLYYGVKDLQQSARIDARADEQLEAHVDTDYYEPFEDLFSVTGVKAIYTIIPDAVAGKGLDSYWYIDEDSVYNEQICGAAPYRHRIWNYRSDVMMVEHTFSCTLYDVHLVPGPMNRAIVIAAPSFTTYVPPFLMRWMYNYPTLDRVETVATPDGYVALTIAREREVFVSIRRKEPTGDCVTIPLSAYCAARDHKATTAYPGVQGIKNILEHCDAKVTTPDLYTLVGFLGWPTELGDVVNYTRSTDPVDPGRPFARLLAPPLVPPAGAPTIHDANTESSIANRVEKVVNNVTPPKKYYGFATEFNKMLMPDDMEKLVPLTRDDAIRELIKDNNSKLMKYLREQKSLTSYTLPAVMAFIKKEVNAGASKKGKESRLIFPLDLETLIQTARFIVPLKNYMLARSRAGKGYTCVGMKPAEVAQRVHEFASKVDTVDQTDFTSMDGTHSQFTNNNYLYMLRRAFKGEHHRQLAKAFERNYSRDVKHPTSARTGALTHKSKRFNSGEMNMSGKADTTEQNNWPNAFVDYCSMRNAGVPPDEAFTKIGPKFGDDGLGDGKYDRATAAKDLGFILKSEVTRSDEPIAFLSRVYPNARASLTSIAEPLRALAKIPVGTHSHGPSFDKTDLSNRVHGYLATDAKSPLIKEYCNALVRVLSLPKPKLDKADRDIVYRVNSGPYPYDDALEADCVNVVAERLRVSITDVEGARTALNNAKTIEDLSKIRLIEPDRLAPGVLAVSPAPGCDR